MKADRTGVELLSARESEVIRRLVAGASQKAIGAELGIRPGSVDTYRQRALVKLKARSLDEASLVLSGNFRQTDGAAVQSIGDVTLTRATLRELQSAIAAQARGFQKALAILEDVLEEGQR